MQIGNLIGLDILLQRLDGSFRQFKLIQQISLVIIKDRLPSLGNCVALQTHAYVF